MKKKVKIGPLYPEIVGLRLIVKKNKEINTSKIFTLPTNLPSGLKMCRRIDTQTHASQREMLKIGNT